MKLEHPEAEQVARILWSATYAAWNLTLGGEQYPNKRDRYERMKKPQPGDMVIELSGGLRGFDCAKAVGWFEREVKEPMHFEEWNVEEDGAIPTERVVYMTAIDGRQCRWVNCEFIQVPSDGGWWNAERWKHKAIIGVGEEEPSNKTP